MYVDSLVWESSGLCGVGVGDPICLCSTQLTLSYGVAERLHTPRVRTEASWETELTARKTAANTRLSTFIGKYIFSVG